MSGWWGWHAGTRRIVTERLRLAVRGLAAPVRLVQVSDTHLHASAWHGPHAGTSFVREVCDAAAAEDPDILVFTGDLSTWHGGGPECARAVIRLLERVPARFGRYACLGNHDVWISRDTGGNLYNGSSVRVLAEEWAVVRIRGAMVALGGLTWRRGPHRAEKLAATMPSVQPRLLLCHDPGGTDDIPDVEDYDLILSGHTHGGQVWLPGIGAPWIGRRTVRGWVRGLHRLAETSYLYVNRGVGTVFVPLRIASTPELTTFELLPKVETSTDEGNGRNA